MLEMIGGPDLQGGAWNQGILAIIRETVPEPLKALNDRGHTDAAAAD
jgi:hypothetical protein